MQRGVLGFVLTLFALIGSALPAQARTEVTVRDANDGTATVTLVGSGWRPGQRLVLVVGRAAFDVQADSGGEFEVPTGLVALGDVPLSLTVRRARAGVEAAEPEIDAGPHPLAILFARSVASGAAGVSVLCAALGAVALTRRLRARTRPRADA